MTQTRDTSTRFKGAGEKASRAFKAGRGYAEEFSQTASERFDEARKTDREEWRKRLRNWKLLTAIFGSIAIVLIAASLINVGWDQSVASSLPSTSGLLAGLLVGFAGGLLIFGLWVLVKRFGVAALGLSILVTPIVMIVLGDIILRDFGMLTGSVNFLWGAGAGIALAVFILTIPKLPISYTPKTKLPNVFGSARWATREDMAEAKLLGADEGAALFLGKDRETGETICYPGDMHALTVAPTRTGKGAAAIIPNLKRLQSSVLVIDPKGENARATWKERKAMGQRIHVIDPWGISTEADRYFDGVPKEHLATFNPLHALDPKDPDIVSDAMLLAEALVTDEGKEPFWENEAKALLQGFILHVVTSPTEEDQRNLGRVRDILCLPTANAPTKDGPPVAFKNTLDGVIQEMAFSKHLVVQQAAFRFKQKAEKERSGVLSTAQANTHFLDSPKIRKSLSLSKLLFSDLKTHEAGVTVYLVLPLDRLVTFNRWLRLLLSSALIDLTRIPARLEASPVRIFKDEFAALRRLDIVETAYGTMAGMGVQLWVFTQDLGQLMRLYGEKTWQTFMSNAGVFQYFGSRDHETAQYAEHLCGITTMRKSSFQFGTSWGQSKGGSDGGTNWSISSGGSESETIDDVSRPLAYADQMMTLRRDLQLLFVENNYPIIALKAYHFKEPETDPDDRYPLERSRPDPAPQPPLTPEPSETTLVMSAEQLDVLGASVPTAPQS